MRVFDFDNTIYDGESSVDFFKYFLVRYPHKVIKYVPTFIKGVVRYKLGKLSIDDLFSECSKMFRECCEAFDNIPGKIELFWDKHEKDVKPAFRDMLLPDDVILSASPEVVLKEICKRMGVKNVIGSDLDIETGDIPIHEAFLYDLMGKLVMHISVNDTRAQLDLTDLTAGTYLLKIKTDKGDLSRKVVKK